MFFVSNACVFVKINIHAHVFDFQFPISISTVFIDGVNESRRRVVDEGRARKLAHDLRRCTYYETCATYGLNVEKVFRDGQLICFFCLKFKSRLWINRKFC